MKKRNLIEEATTWALAESKSTAKTNAGIQKAVKNWLDGRELISTYLDALQAGATKEMADDLAHRKEVEKERKAMRKIPIYARYRFADTTEVKKTYEKHAGSLNIPEYIEKAISDIAYDTLFGLPEYSRLRKRYKGDNTAVDASVRTEDNGKWGWDRVVWHYADYSATISPDGRHIWVDYGKGFREHQIAISGLCVIGGRHIRKPEVKTKITLKPHHLRRLYTSVIRGNDVVVWEWNTEEKAGEYIHTTTGESYHTPAYTTNPKKVFREAVRAFRLRRDEKRRKQAKLKALEKVYVTAENSVAAGNCRVRTEKFREELGRIYGMPIIAISAAVLLAMRDDAYTRRAVRYAMQK